MHIIFSICNLLSEYISWKILLAWWWWWWRCNCFYQCQSTQHSMATIWWFSIMMGRGNNCYHLHMLRNAPCANYQNRHSWVEVHVPFICCYNTSLPLNALLCIPCLQFIVNTEWCYCNGSSQECYCSQAELKSTVCDPPLWAKQQGFWFIDKTLLHAWSSLRFKWSLCSCTNITIKAAKQWAAS